MIATQKGIERSALLDCFSEKGDSASETFFCPHHSYIKKSNILGRLSITGKSKLKMDYIVYNTIFPLAFKRKRGEVPLRGLITFLG